MFAWMDGRMDGYFLGSKLVGGRFCFLENENASMKG